MNKTLKKLCRTPGILLTTLAVTVCAGAADTTHMDATYLLSGVENSAIILDGSRTVPEMPADGVIVSQSGEDYNISLSAGLPVTVFYEGKVLTDTSKNETISSLLYRLHVVPGPLDMVSVDLSGGEIALTVASDITLYEKVSEPAPFKTIRRPNSNLPEGQERVVQTGSNGVRTSTYEVVWSNGKQISKQFVETLENTSKDRIVEYGTAKLLPSTVKENIHSPIANVTKNADGSGILTLQSGEKLAFSSVQSMKATAYTAGHDGVGTRTATGTTVRRGTVAVDKRCVPLGTRMYIVTNDGSYVYGLSVAEDTGYVGRNLDLYHNTYNECINFGRRGVTVYMLK